MKVCILGKGLTALTLAKALVNQNINVDYYHKKKYKYSQSEQLVFQKVILNFLKKNIINIEKIIWKLKRIEIYTDNLKKKNY